MKENKAGKKRDAAALYEPLSAIELKQQLWETLQNLRAGKITAGSGDAVAAQAREILRCVKVQLAIFGQAGKSVSEELIDFAKPKRGQ